MRIIFIGGLEYGWHCLKAILENSNEVLGIFTLDKKYSKNVSGFRPFDDLSAEYNVPIFKIQDINEPKNVMRIKELDPDVIFVLGWSQLVSKEILEIPKQGCVGIHPTLLPKNRGRAPIPWTLIKGLEKSGITMFFMDEGVDSGDIIAQKEFEITIEDDAKSLYEKVTKLSIDFIIEYLPLFRKGKVPRIPQDHKKATYWPKRRPEDGIMDWNKSSFDLYNWIRGLTHPYPGAFTYVGSKKLMIWKSSLLEGFEKHIKGTHGQIIGRIEDEGFVVCTGDGFLLIKRVQLEGDEEMNASLFLKKYGVNTGFIFRSNKKSKSNDGI